MARLDDGPVLAALAAELHADRDVTTTARTVVTHLTTRLSGVVGAALSTSSGGRRAVLAASDDTAAALAESWPDWDDAVARLGVAAVLAVPLAPGARDEDVLTLLADAPGVLEPTEVRQAVEAYAVHAGLALEAARHVSGLEVALRSRHTIGMAQGMLMERFDLDPERSFALLRRLSSTHERKLRDVAAHLVATGELPGGAADGVAGEAPPVPDGV